MTDATENEELTPLPEQTGEYILFEKYLSRYLFEHPDVSRKDAHSIFQSGWRYRVEAARAETQSFRGSDAAVVLLHTVEQLVNTIRHLSNLRSSYFVTESELRRKIDQYGHMIRTRGGSTDDAPAWRRIAMQRRELRALTKKNRELRGRIAELEEEERQ